MVGVVDVELDIPGANLRLGIVPVGSLVAAACGEGQVSGRLLVKAIAAVGIAQFVAIAQAVALADAEHFCSETLRSPHDIAQVGVRSTDDHHFTGQLAGVAAAQSVGRQGVGAWSHVADGERAVALRLCPVDVAVTLVVRLGRLRQHYAYGRGRIVVIHRQASADGGALRGVQFMAEPREGPLIFQLRSLCGGIGNHLAVRTFIDIEEEWTVDFFRASGIYLRLRPEVVAV